MLGHDFFVEHAAAHSQMKEIAGGMKRIEANTEALLEGQAQIIKMSAATQALVKKSTSKVKTCWGDAHERSEWRPAFGALRGRARACARKGFFCDRFDRNLI